MICHDFLVLHIRPSWGEPSCGRAMGRDAGGCRAWEADWLNSSHVCWAMIFLLMVFSCFYERGARHGVLSLGWGLKRWQNWSEMAHWLCALLLQDTVQLSLHCCASSRKGKRGRKRMLGTWSVTSELFTHVVSPSVLQTRHGSAGPAVPQVWAPFAGWALTWRAWLMALTLAK